MITIKKYDNKNINLEKWELFIDSSNASALYFRSWFLDAVCENWHVIIAMNGDKWLAVFPFVLKRKYFINYTIQPKFTKYLGILFSNELTDSETLNEQKKIMTAIINELPKNIIYLNYCFLPTFTYFLPFFWKGFTVTPKITFRLTVKNENKISTSILNHIKKANLNRLQCVEENSLKNILNLLQIRKLINSNEINIFNDLWKKVKNKNTGFSLNILDNKGNTHCGAAIIIDKENAYLILSVVNFKFKKDGGNALLINTIIEKLKNSEIKYLYFEGSMFENVATYIQGFKAEPMLYYNITKSKIPLLYNFFLPFDRIFMKFLNLKIY